MSDMTRRWYQRPWMIGGTILCCLVLLCVIGLSAQTIRYMMLIKSGKLNPQIDPRQQQFEASVSAAFANPKVTSEDLARIAPKAAFPELGSPTATVQIIEFLDYRCPFCKRTAPVLRAFMSKHSTDTRLIIRDFPITELHPDAEDAAVAADCVFRLAPERYWDYHDRLFSDQAGQKTPDDLRVFATQLGLNMADFDSCVKFRVPLATIRQSEADGAAAGIEGTPTFFFNGVKVPGALDERTLELIVREARAHAKK